MAKRISVPEYLLLSMVRHYEALAGAEIPHDNLRALNAKRVAPKEISRLKRLIDGRDKK